MHKFHFKLQKILEYREAIEEQAKKAYLEKKARLLEAETALRQIAKRRHDVLLSSAHDLATLQAKETFLLQLDEEERSQKIIINVLQTEEEKARLLWQEKNKEAKTLQKLKEHRKQEWIYLFNKEEQNAMDDFATMRRQVA